MHKLSENIIQKIKKLHDDGYSNMYIAKLLKVSNNTVSKYLKERFGIINYKQTRKIDHDKFVELWNMSKSDEEIAAYFNASVFSVKSYRTKGNNASKYNRIRYKSQTIMNMSLEQEQMVRGSLLGDMNLSNPKMHKHINSRLALVHSTKQKELFMSKVNILGEFMESYREHIYLDIRTNNTYHTMRGNSCSHKIFTSIYNELYIDGKKSITKEYLNSITHPIALAYWFMDDGTYRGSIATNGFTYNEIILLQTWMNTFWGIACSIQKNKNNYILYILSCSRQKFEELIFPYLIPEMYYKLKYRNVLIAQQSRCKIS